jgi:hypothetical protein
VPADADRSPKLPFWVHQVVEYGIGVLLAYQAIHSPRPVVPLLAGLAVIALAATADGPAAAWHVVPRRVHRVCDVIVAVGLVAVAIVFGHQAGTAGQIMLLVGALALAALLLRSDYRPRPVKAARPTPAAGTPPSGSVTAEAVGRAAGRVVGRGVQAYRQRSQGKNDAGR